MSGRFQEFSFAELHLLYELDHDHNSTNDNENVWAVANVQQETNSQALRDKHMVVHTTIDRYLANINKLKII